MYLLAREWVANNPHKPIYVRPSTILAGSSVQLPPPLPPTPLSTAKLVPRIKRTATVAGLSSADVLPDLEIDQSSASAELILQHHVQHAKEVRRWVKAQRQAMLDRYRPRLLKLLCGGQGLSQANMPMPVQPNMPEAAEAVQQSAAAAVAAEAARITADVIAGAARASAGDGSPQVCPPETSGTKRTTAPMVGGAAALQPKASQPDVDAAELAEVGAVTQPPGCPVVGVPPPDHHVDGPAE